MLKSLNITTITPELGTIDVSSRYFFLKTKEVIKEVLDENFRMINFSFSWLAREFPTDDILRHLVK